MKLVKEIKAFYAFLLTKKEITEEYRMVQLQRKFNLPRVYILWAINY